MTFCALAIASSRRPPATVARFDSMARRSGSAGSTGASACVADGGFSRGFFEAGIGSSFCLPLMRRIFYTPPRFASGATRRGSPSPRRCRYRHRESCGKVQHWFGLSCVVLGDARIQGFRAYGDMAYGVGLRWFTVTHAYIAFGSLNRVSARPASAFVQGSSKSVDSPIRGLWRCL
jgi:hypothetical protein